MPIENIPDIYLNNCNYTNSLFVYDLKMVKGNTKTKVNLNMHMFSFLQRGKKHVYFADKPILVDNSQSILIEKGNCLWSELLDSEETYYCKLLFFSDKKLQEFIENHQIIKEKSDFEKFSHFIIENDSFINSYLNSLNALSYTSTKIISLKFEELLLYLLSKYGNDFKNYLLSLVTVEKKSLLKNVVENNLYTSLNLEEIAFLCNMSLSTFKRSFTQEYNESPGKWFRNHRLERAKELIEKRKAKPSEVYLDLGYNNLSNFSIAFKRKFNINPSEI